jgi:hypothetical protein
MRAGRDVLLVRAVPRVSEGFSSWDLHALGEGADEYELEVDAERGILLRAEARRDRQSIQVYVDFRRGRVVSIIPQEASSVVPQIYDPSPPKQ